jgi:hypothetical protein
MTLAVNLAQGASNNVTFRNKIINGNMVINQRGFSGTPASLEYTLDRWRALMSTASSKFTVSQNAGSVTPPAGFINYLGVTSSSAYSVVAADQYGIQQWIEGYNIADLDWGTASAQPVTLSFWVRSSLTGTFGGSLGNSGGSRSYPFTFTISSANTWEQKSITVTGDTSGTWLTDNSRGLGVVFGLGVGSTLSGTAGSWSGNDYRSATGAVSVVGTNGATFYITGVQLEAGTTASPFEYRQYGTELALCQRYYFGNFYGQGGVCFDSATLPISLRMPVYMRAAPSFSLKSGSNVTTDVYGGGGTSSATIGFTDQFSPIAFRVSISQSSGGIRGVFFSITNDNIQVSAEL